MITALRWAVEAAARIASRIIRHHRVAVCQKFGNAREHTGVGSSTSDQQQYRTPRLRNNGSHLALSEYLPSSDLSTPLHD